MRGHVRKRGSSWQVIVSTSDPATGKRRHLSATRPTKAEAEAALLRLLAQAGRSSSGGTSATMGELLGAWQELNEAAWSPATTRQTRARVDRYLRPRLGRVLVRKIRTSDLELLYAELRRAGGVPTAQHPDGAPLAASTVRKVHNDLSSALEQAVRWEWIADNPAARVDTRKRFVGPRRTIAPPSAADALRLIAAAHDADPDFGSFVHLAAALGARRGELCALRWADLDLDAGAVTVERSIALGDELVEKTTKTGNRRRVALDAGTVAVVRAHRRRALERAFACGITLRPDAFVFSLDVDGARPWRPDLPTKRFIRLREDLGLSGVRLHDLRHFSVTQLLAAGVDLATVAARHGHAGGGRTTLAVYGHLVEAADRSAADAMGAVLRS